MGPNLAAVFVPLGPILTALIVIAILAEYPTAVQWVGIVLVAVGMIGSARYEVTGAGGRS